VTFALLVPTPAAGAQPHVSARLVSTEGSLASRFGDSVALSADGRTALVGAPLDSEGRGAAWVFVKTEAGWVQQGGGLFPSDVVGQAEVGSAVALSEDGDVAIVGGLKDDGSRGAAWIFTRGNGVWTQQGAKLQPSDADPGTSAVLFGASVALSADASTAIVGGYGDTPGGYGAAWVFTRSGGSWSQQGPKLAPANETLGADGFYSWFGVSVALSGDGSTALIGGQHDDEQAGAAWVFVRSGSSWTQQGEKLTSGEHVGPQLFGNSVALSGDGNTALVAGEEDNGGYGAVWTFVRNGSSWEQVGGKLTPPNLATVTKFGRSVAIDATGTHALVGLGPGAELGAELRGEQAGPAWLYNRSGSGWSAQPEPISSEFISFESFLGWSVALSREATALLVGAPSASPDTGAAWMFESDANARLYIPFAVFADAAFPPNHGIEAEAFFLVATQTGTVTWKWYGPNAPGCSGPPIGVVQSTVAYEAGYAHTKVVLPTPTLGKYLLVASYGGDSNDAAATTACGEQVIDVRSRPTLVPSVTGALRVGSPVRIAMSFQDGTEPSGTVTLKIFSVQDPSCSETPLSVQTLNVAQGVSTEAEYVPTETGPLYYQAKYSGDENNYGANLLCAEGAAAPVVGPAQPTIAVTAPSSVLVGDPIAGLAQTLGGFRPTGTVELELFPPSDPACAAAAAAAVDAPLSGGAAASEQFATTVTGNYHFIAIYGGDPDNQGTSSSCAAGAVQVLKRRPTLTVQTATGIAGYGSLESTAHLSGAFAPEGNVRFYLYKASQHCRGGRLLIPVLATVSGATATTGPLGTVGPGRYEIVAEYEGDADNEPARSTCGAHPLTIPPILQRAKPTLSGVRVTLHCSGVTTDECRGSVTITVKRNGHHAMSLGTAFFALRRGSTTTRTIPLDIFGTRLLHSRRRLAAVLTVRLHEGASIKTVQQVPVTIVDH
jgi:hypothetical protein